MISKLNCNLNLLGYQTELCIAGSKTYFLHATDQVTYMLLIKKFRDQLKWENVKKAVLFWILDRT